MIKDTVLKAMNDQIQKELSSAYLYLSMAAAMDAQNLPGFAKWLKVQAEEERGHGMKIYDHVCDRGGRVILDAIEKPPSKFNSPLEVFEAVLEHERKVTASIHKLYELAVREKDYPTQTMLHWFIAEQVEEEKTAEQILAELQAVGERKHALLFMDRHMGQRGG